MKGGREVLSGLLGRFLFLGTGFILEKNLIMMAPLVPDAISERAQITWVGEASASPGRLKSPLPISQVNYFCRYV